MMLLLIIHKPFKLLKNEVTFVNQSEILIHQTDVQTKVEVTMDGDTV